MARPHPAHFLPIVAVFVAGLPLLLFTLRAFDQLVLFQRLRHPGAWEADGRPHPLLFRAGHQWPRSIRSDFASHYCGIAWVLSTPDWTRSDPEARHLLRRLRILTAAWNLVFMPIYVAVLVLTVRFG